MEISTKENLLKEESMVEVFINIRQEQCMMENGLRTRSRDSECITI